MILKILSRLLLGVTVICIALVLLLRWINPTTSAVIIAWELESGRSARHQWRSLQAISPQLQIAVIASEDQKFPDHFGFDFKSIRQSLGESGDRPRGASTISQQVAKNLFLWNGRSYFRKALEACFTALIEILWPKQRILEVYLNIAEFGEGIYGAEAAAQKFYRQPAQRIGSWQAALLAAVLPNPKNLSAERPSAYVRERASAITVQIRRLGGVGYLGKIKKAAGSTEKTAYPIDENIFL